MSLFTDEQIALLEAAGVVRIATLAAFEFDPVMRYWNGDYTLTAGGFEWSGLGGLGQIDGLVESRTGESTQVRFTLTGTDDEINAIAMRQASEQAGVLATAFAALTDDDWQPVGEPVELWAGLTQPLSASSISAPEGKGRQRSIVLPAENFYFSRSRPPFGTYDDRSHQARFPGDPFFIFQSRYKAFTYVWP